MTFLDSFIKREENSPLSAFADIPPHCGRAKKGVFTF
jgi:hypothetical protein